LLLATSTTKNFNMTNQQSAYTLHSISALVSPMDSKAENFPAIRSDKLDDQLCFVLYRAGVVLYCGLSYRAGWFFDLLRRACGPMSRSMLAVEWNYNITTVIRGKP
jgi:hypothetical protein